MSHEATTEVGSLREHVGETVTVRGWADATRSHGKVGFLVVRDGTGLVQGVLLKSDLPEDTWALHESITQESTVALTGEVREEPRAPGGFEIGVTTLELLGLSEEYPIQPKEHGVEFLLDHRHLWLRSSLQRAGLRVRHEVEQAIHDYFYERDFVRVDTPILTGSIGESAGTLFETDYFGESAYLAQTGQLYVETACPAFRKVYCFGPTFRAEKSKTRRHLTEFWMVEPEVAFADSNDNMRLQEDFVCHIVERALERCTVELEILERDTSELEAVASPFARISYSDAITLLQGERKRGRMGKRSPRTRRDAADRAVRPAGLRARLSKGRQGVLHEGKSRRPPVPCSATICSCADTGSSSAGASGKTTWIGCWRGFVRRSCPRRPTRGTWICGATERSCIPGSGWVSSAPWLGSRGGITSGS